MSDFNNYARRVNELMLEKIEEYKKLSDRLDHARERQAKAKLAYDKALHSDFMMPPDTAVEAARAKAELVDAEGAFNTFKTALPNKVKQSIGIIRQELAEDLDKALAIDPTALDSGTVELLKSGMLTSSDYKRLADNSATNPTMLRMIASYAQKTLDSIPVDEISRSGERASLLGVIDRGKGATPESFLTNFDGLANIADRVASNPGIMDSWAMLADPVVEVF